MYTLIYKYYVHINKSISLHLTSRLIFHHISHHFSQSANLNMHVKHILLLNHRDVPEYILQMLISNMRLSMYNVGLIAARNASVVRSFSKNIIIM